VCGRARAGGRGLKRRGELGQARIQLEGGGLVVEAIVRVGRMRVFGWWGVAWVAGATGRGRGLGADDGRRTVDLTEVCERDLEGRGALAGLLGAAALLGGFGVFRRAGAYGKVHVSSSLPLRAHDAGLGPREGVGIRGSADDGRAVWGVVAALAVVAGWYGVEVAWV